VLVNLSYSYSGSSTIIVERKSTAAYEAIQCKRLSQSVLVDTTLDPESDNTFIYRIKVIKTIDGKEYSTSYSNEVNFQYTSTVLNGPTGLALQTFELQGIKLTWDDRTSKELGYKVEKNSGSGFAEIATLAPNTTSYMDNIAGIQNPPLNLTYRVKAYNANLSSATKEASTTYAGLGSPTDLKILDSAFYKFTIGWTRNSSIATGYVVERRKDNGVYSGIATVGATVATYADTSIADSGSYAYRVRAIKDNLSSSYTNEIGCLINNILPTLGLVAYYPFNGNANDESGNGNNGTVHGTTSTSDRFGNANNAQYFNGSSYINYPELFSATQKAFSFSLWVEINNISSQSSILYKGSINGEFQVNAQVDKFNFGIHLSSGLYDWTTVASQDYVKNKFYHLAGIYKQGNSIELWVNGILANTVSIPSLNLYVGATISSIGAYNNITYSQYVNGIIDDVRIYNRALSGSEIQALYHEGGWK
jgi:hypothetical protein